MANKTLTITLGFTPEFRIEESPGGDCAYDSLTVRYKCVTCMLFIINLLFTWFLNDLDISGKQVVYICFKIVLERKFQMFYHETFWNVKKNLVFS